MTRFTEKVRSVVPLLADYGVRTSISPAMIWKSLALYVSSGTP